MDSPRNAIEHPGPLMVRGHVRCLGPDGQVKWEADTVPFPLGIAVDGDCAAPPAPEPDYEGHFPVVDAGPDLGG